jgi:predicted transcriptional regulator
MESKGWLTHREEGRTHLYSAARNRDATIGQKVLEVLDQVCGGSPAAMMAALIDYRGLKTAELKRIHALLEAAKSQKRPSGEKK